MSWQLQCKYKTFQMETDAMIRDNIIFVLVSFHRRNVPTLFFLSYRLIVLCHWNFLYSQSRNVSLETVIDVKHCAESQDPSTVRD